MVRVSVLLSEQELDEISRFFSFYNPIVRSLHNIIYYTVYTHFSWIDAKKTRYSTRLRFACFIFKYILFFYCRRNTKVFFGFAHKNNENTRACAFARPASYCVNIEKYQNAIDCAWTRTYTIKYKSMRARVE